ncbi:hypothetical protein [Hymenobacter sp. DG25B]|uniref:hypothetical protein n=1 Tax=Hymenobacter sp. DG25B TaxID=1385664 RepID=UPI0012E0BC36|nr:hypothetical protein [Hymenobacter sp. DG25B]
MRTHSPYQAREALDGISMLIVDPHTRAGDSLLVALGYNNHEGGVPAYVSLRPGAQPNTLAFSLEGEDSNQSALGYRIVGADTLLQLWRYDATLKGGTTQTFRKVPGLLPQGDSLAYSTTYALNQLLLAGQYTGVDSLGQRCKVFFTATGEVRGLPHYQRYTPQFDYVGLLDNDLDYLLLDPDSDHPTHLAFTLHTDTLRLYAVHADTSQHLHRGALHYTLVRRP